MSKPTIKRQNLADIGYGPDGAPLPSDQLVARVKEYGGDTILLSFSMGKDSLAMWLYLRDKGFKIIPYFLHWVPGMSYVEKPLAYYEQFFGQKILRLPHPLFYNMVRTWAYQEPHVISTVMSFDMLTDYDYASIDDTIAAWHGPKDPLPFCAIGMRSADNMERRRLIQQQGSIGIKRRRYYYAIWDWNVEQVSRIIVEAKCALPPDYKHWGRTLTAYHYQYLSLMRQAFPADYAKMLQWFPLLELEFFRYEAMKHHEPDPDRAPESED